MASFHFQPLNFTVNYNIFMSSATGLWWFSQTYEWMHQLQSFQKMLRVQ